MKAIPARRSITLCVSILILFVTVASLNVDATAFAALAFPPARPDLLSGITFANSASNADTRYLRDSLQFLHDHLPEWYVYVDDAKPFIISIGQTDEKGWEVANSKCCDEHGQGIITFDDHFEQSATSSDPIVQTTQARQVAFLSTLVHEVTHLRDYRAGRIPTKIDMAMCLSSEAVAYAKEFELKSAVALTIFQNDAVGEKYRLAANQQLAADTNESYTRFWKLYCILAHQNIMDD
ncbi:MAG: hypothetical protein HY868_11565 [Chloroflexi bacterium]|nr:hypothetical protein [Chloroflexota bacterium]